MNRHTTVGALALLLGTVLAPVGAGVAVAREVGRIEGGRAAAGAIGGVSIEADGRHPLGYEFVATLDGPGVDLRVPATVDWGDGTVDRVEVVRAPAAAEIRAEHRYAERGAFVVTLTMSGGDRGAIVWTGDIDTGDHTGPGDAPGHDDVPTPDEGDEGDAPTASPVSPPADEPSAQRPTSRLVGVAVGVLDRFCDLLRGLITR